MRSLRKEHTRLERSSRGYKRAHKTRVYPQIGDILD